MNKREFLDFETRLAADEAGTFTGYAARFGERNSYDEIVKKGAFKRTLSDHKSRRVSPPMLWSHNPDSPVGVWTSIREDDEGLAVEGRLITGTERGREALELLKAGAVSGLSIGFRTVRQERTRDGGRILTEIDLVEISIVAVPAANGARIKSVRSASPQKLKALAIAARAAAQTLRGQNHE